jgi:O-antigen/teichoic acid export membrane protein
MFVGGNTPDEGKQIQIRRLYAVEIFLAVMVPLCINILWSPVVDMLFKGKYGSVNATEMILLSLCIPLLFIINLLWTLVFSIKKYKEISFITFLSAICNLATNMILIPKYGGLGAAIAFLLTIVLQVALYYRLVFKYIMKFSVLLPIVLFSIAGLAYFISIYVSSNVFVQLPLALLIYTVVSILTKTIGKNHLDTLKSMLKK